MDTIEIVDTVVVGAGQAGLVTARELARRGRGCVVLDREARVGDGWRHHYDSLRLYNPGRYVSLPGLAFPGDPDTCPGKDEVADYLSEYAEHFRLPVRTGTTVDHLGPAADGSDGYDVATSRGTIRCRNVVIASGGQGRAPAVPAFAEELDPGILQLHSSQYRRPGQLRDGSVLVVGASHSGCDIALELAEERETHLAGRDCGQLPLRWHGTAAPRAMPVVVFAWKHVLTRRTPMGRREMAHVRSHGGPMLRVKREHLDERGVVRHLQRVESVTGGRPALADGTVLDVANVVWATGYRQRYDWVDLPVVGEDGWPREYRGVAADVPGVYFCGLAFQYSFASMVLPGVGRDARYVVDHLVAHRPPVGAEDAAHVA
jgi:putative flavoprotein involved in K+ transport